MASMLMHLEVDDYDRWKAAFDADPAGRAKSAKGYIVYRAVDEPGKVYIGVEFASVEEAKSFRERLLASGALDNPAMTIVTPPTIVEVADQGEY